MLNILHI